MKRSSLSRRQILCAIQAAGVAFFLAATAQRAQAADYTPPYYTINGDIVTGSGTSANAYFNANGNKGFSVNVQAGANLSSEENEEIAFDHGTVNNQGTLGSDFENAIEIYHDGTVSNYGTISADVAGISIDGDTGTVVNYASGTISGRGAAINFDGNGTVNNAGTLSSYSSSYGDGIFVKSTGNINNSGRILVADHYIADGIFSSEGTVTNSGYIHTFDSQSAYGVYMNQGTVANTGEILGGSIPFQDEEEGDTEYGYGVYMAGNNGVVINTGIIGGVSTTSEYFGGGPQAIPENQAAGVGVYFGGKNGTLINTGEIAGVSATFEEVEDIEPAIPENEGTGIGVYFGGKNGTLINTGEIIGDFSPENEEGGELVAPAVVPLIPENEFPAAAGAYFADNNGQVYNYGMIEGLYETDDFGPAYGVYFNKTGSLFNSGSGYIFGTGVGVQANGTATVFNAGFIQGDEEGVLLNGDNSTLITVGGLISTEDEVPEIDALPAIAPIGFGDAIQLAGKNSTATIVGRALTQGEIDGTKRSYDNTLNFDLSGLSPAEVAQFAKYIKNHPHDGSFTFTKDNGEITYDYENFNGVVDNSISLEQNVDPGLQILAGKLDNNILPHAYDPLYAAAFYDAEGALNQFSGREFYDAFATLNLSNTLAVDELAESRDFDLRHGAGGFDLSQLRIVPGSMIASLGETEDVLGQMLGSGRLGGTTMSDSKDEKNVTNDGIEPPRWGAWAAGTVTLADESSTNNSYDATTGSPSIGVDYRLSHDLAVGALFSYSTIGADFGDGSHLGENEELLGLYATYLHGPWYVNSLLGFGYQSYNDNRVTTTGGTASSNPQGDEVLANLTGGYEFKYGHWSIDPEAGFEYTHLGEEGYSENGAGAFDLNVASQAVDSIRTKVGFRALGDYTWAGLHLSPDVHASWYHECLDDARGVSVGVPGAPVLGSFVVRTNEPERDFALVGAGLSATPRQFHEAVTFFVNYDAQVGQADFIAHTFNGGLRIGF